MALGLLQEPRVLYLDDELDICSLMQDTFGAQGIEAVTFLDPVKALSDVKKNHYELLITDYHLRGGKNGIDHFLRQAKPYVPDAKLVVMSAEESRKIGRDANEVGALYVVKSGSPVAFVASVSKQVKKKLLLPSSDPKAFY